MDAGVRPLISNILLYYICSRGKLSVKCILYANHKVLILFVDFNLAIDRIGMQKQIAVLDTPLRQQIRTLKYCRSFYVYLTAFNLQPRKRKTAHQYIHIFILEHIKFPILYLDSQHTQTHTYTNTPPYTYTRHIHITNTHTHTCAHTKHAHTTVHTKQHTLHTHTLHCTCIHYTRTHYTTSHSHIRSQLYYICYYYLLLLCRN